MQEKKQINMQLVKCKIALKGLSRNTVCTRSMPFPGSTSKHQAPRPTIAFKLLFMFEPTPFLFLKINFMKCLFIMLQTWYFTCFKCPPPWFSIISILVLLFRALSTIVLIASTWDIIMQKLWIWFPHWESVYRWNMENINITIEWNKCSTILVKVKIYVQITGDEL